ncbi:MAG: DUF559 domain-containing protein [Candidatus Dormibacteraeota bacterium]|nr:DUF559 domain-containing protein [Candidatus Dormibacteraeota bacterium]
MARRAVVPAELKKGPFTLDEARSAGLTPRQLEGGSWRRLARGVYAWKGLPPGPALILAAISRCLPPGAAFSGRSAAWLHGLDLPPCDPIEVTVPPALRLLGRAGITVLRADLSPCELVERLGLPATSALRTLVDLGSRPPLVEAVIAVDMALHAHLVEMEELRLCAAHRPGRKGVVQLRQVLNLAEPAAESPMETRLRVLLVQSGLPRPEVQATLKDERGRFLGRTDLYYPVHRLGLEYDGGTHRDSLAEDNRRQNRLLNAGFRLLRFTAADVLRTPESVVAQVRQALGRSERGSGT